MEGTPVREPERVRSAIGLHQAQNREALQLELTRLSKEELQDADVFVALADSETRELQMPAGLESQIQTHRSLIRKLQLGELVGLTYDRSSVVMVPIVFQAELHGAIGVFTSLDGPQLSHESLEGIRQLACLSAPLFARFFDIESLQQRIHELNAIVQMRTHLQSNIAHELRTPLAAIRGYARMILDGRAGEINATQKDYLNIIAENTNRLVHLIEWMVHIAERTSKHLKLSKFDLRDVWEECLASSEALTDRIKIEQQVPRESFVMAGDREKLLHVFRTMTAVAAKAMAQSGNMRVEFSRGREHEIVVKLSCTAEIGGDSDSARSDLSEVHDVVGMHGGRVFVTGKAGDGTSLIITLPAVTTDKYGA